MGDNNSGGAGRHGNIGKYQLLYKYLRDRFADRVVLTFGEIEDVLGFPLPPAARVEAAWWGDGDGTGDRNAQNDAWKLSDRTAIANFNARTVIFERQSSR